MDIGSSPKCLTTKRTVKYRKSVWSVHEFEVWSGELICRVVALRMVQSLLVWVGGREAKLSEIAVGMPLGAGRGALATALLGEEGGAAGLARRLALALQLPVHICCGQTFDRFTAPLVEKGIVTEIRNHPELFSDSKVNNVLVKNK